MRLLPALLAAFLAPSARAAGVKLVEAPATPVNGPATPVTALPQTPSLPAPGALLPATLAAAPATALAPAASLPALTPAPGLLQAAAAQAPAGSASAAGPQAAAAQASLQAGAEPGSAGAAGEGLAFAEGRRRFDGAGDPVAESLSALAVQGHAFVPPGKAMSPALEDAVVADLSRLWQEQAEPTLTVTLLDEEKGWRGDLGTSAGGVQAYVRRLADSVRRALPGEDLVPVYVLARLTRGGEAAVNHPHVDGDYLAATYPLRGEGTVVYSLKDGKLVTEQAGARSLAVLSGEERERLTGVEADVHAAPGGMMDERAVLIVMFARRAAAEPAAEVKERVKRAATRRLRDVEARLGR